MTFSLPDNLDDDQGSDQSPLDQASDFKDKFDTGKNLKDKLAGGGNAGKGAAGAGAEGASTGAGAAASGAGSAGAGGAAGAGAAAGTGAAAAGGAATGGAAAGAAGATAASGGLAAPIAVPVVVGSLATTKTGRKILIATIIGIFGGCLMLFALPLLVILMVFIPILGGGPSTGQAAGADGNSTNLTISKTASVTSFAKGAVNASVTYTITVKNSTTREAKDITVSDVFSSSPEASLASEIKGHTPSYTIAVLPPGGVDTRSYTVSVPHTDFDPGWILFNTVNSTGTIEGSLEKSTAGATVVIGKPPTGPPTFSPLKNPRISGYIFNEWAEGSNGIYKHQGLDIDDANNIDTDVYSPFAQPAKVVLNNPDLDGENDGFGNYVILESGEWTVYLTHLKYQSSLIEGQVVDSSTSVGIIGESGFADGSHVHYEVHQGTSTLDPALYNALVPHP